MHASNPTESDRPQLGLWDAVSIIVGIVVGVTIFKSPPLIFQNVSNPWSGFWAWTLGGGLSLIGALCYAELATTYPRTGGDYVYLTRAFGPMIGFLFGWAQLMAVLTGSTGSLAYVFADYTTVLLKSPREYAAWLAAAAVLVLTVVNLLGVVAGKLTQNLLTVAKVGGLLGLLLAGLFWGEQPVGGVAEVRGPGFGLAMILILYAYGGWSDSAFVAAEVRNRRRNIPLALLLGISLITVLYLLVNVAYVRVLGFDMLRNPPKGSTPAAEVLGVALGTWGADAMSVLVIVSALGAINGLIFAGSRVYAALGTDYRLFALLGRWNPRLGVPVFSLMAQAVVALSMILVVGTTRGQQLVDSILVGARETLAGWFPDVARQHADDWLAWAGLDAIPWSRFEGGFEMLLAATAPVFWLFFLLTGLSLFALRELDKQLERPFKAPGYPFVPFVFCLMCTYMLYSSITYAQSLTFVGLGPLLVGMPLYLVSGRRRDSGERSEG
jgi:amino acid transporter